MKGLLWVGLGCHGVCVATEFNYILFYIISCFNHMSWIMFNIIKLHHISICFSENIYLLCDILYMFGDIYFDIYVVFLLDHQ